jgi:hypothetical protein
MPVILRKKGASFVDIKGLLPGSYAFLKTALSLEHYGPAESVLALTIRRRF